MRTQVGWPETTASIPLRSSVKAMMSAAPVHPPSSAPSADIATTLGHLGSREFTGDEASSLINSFRVQ